MGKAKRKARPDIPYWAWLDRDGCYGCKNRRNCNQCKANRQFLKEYGPPKQKGRKPISLNRKEMYYD